MDKAEIMSRLETLAEHLRARDSLVPQVQAAREEVQRAQAIVLYRLEEFDNAHKQAYIEDQIGLPPVAPDKGNLINYPAYLSKKKAYDKALEEYEEKLPLTDKEYYAAYAQIRKETEEKEQAEKDKQIGIATKRLSELTEALEQEKAAIAAETIVQEKYKTEEDLMRLAGYFQEGRVDTWKQAINLFYEDKERMSLEELLKSHLELINLAVESAKNAAADAKAANDHVQQAIQAAQIAARKASDAMDRANAAYEKASRFEAPAKEEPEENAGILE